MNSIFYLDFTSLQGKARQSYVSVCLPEVLRDLLQSTLKTSQVFSFACCLYFAGKSMEDMLCTMMKLTIALLNVPN